MYCKHCGKFNSETSQYCKYCGEKISTETIQEVKASNETIDSNTSPYPFVISNWKLAILSICTFGLYDIYWFYKQWKSYKADKKLKVSPFWRSIFSPIFSYSLFKNISNASKDLDKNKGVEAGALAVVYFFLCRVWPLSFLPLIPAQNSINFYWDKKLGNKLERSKFGTWNWIIAVCFVIFIFYAFNDSSTANQTANVNTPSSTPTTNQTNTSSGKSNSLSSVVNIFCDNKEGGSGTILADTGLILTNNHVITGSVNCLVTLPDPNTGEPISIYQAKPLIYPGLSKQYDLAALSIYSAYTDSEGKSWGTYPTTFQIYDNPAGCSTTTFKLGDPIKIYGYPVTSGGYNLTVTEGVISSFANDGTVLTSAKIDSGNSGGLAVDQSGCMIGIPSAVQQGNYQNLGVIIPNNLILEFINKATQ